MDAEKRIEELGIELPASSPAKAMYIPAKRVGSTLYVSGQTPMLGGEMPLRGRARGAHAGAGAGGGKAALYSVCELHV